MMIKNISLALAALVAVTWISYTMSLGTTYCVRADGTASNLASATGDGSNAASCATFDKITSASLGIGDRVILDGSAGAVTALHSVNGSNDAVIVLDAIRGSMINPVTFIAQNSPVIRHDSANGAGIILRNDTKHVVFDGFRHENTSSAGGNQDQFVVQEDSSGDPVFGDLPTIQFKNGVMIGLGSGNPNSGDGFSTNGSGGLRVTDYSVTDIYGAANVQCTTAHSTSTLYLERVTIARCLKANTNVDSARVFLVDPIIFDIADDASLGEPIDVLSLAPTNGLLDVTGGTITAPTRIVSTANNGTGKIIFRNTDITQTANNGLTDFESADVLITGGSLTLNGRLAASGNARQSTVSIHQVPLVRLEENTNTQGYFDFDSGTTTVNVSYQGNFTDLANAARTGNVYDAAIFGTTTNNTGWMKVNGGVYKGTAGVAFGNTQVMFMANNGLSEALNNVFIQIGTDNRYIRGNSTVHPFTLANNIVHDAGDEVSGGPFTFYLDEGDGTNLSVTHNMFSGTTNADTQGTNVIAGDPTFTDAGADDYSLAASSIGKGAGSRAWSGANPIGLNDLIPDTNIDLGASVDQDSDLHPLNLVGL